MSEKCSVLVSPLWVTWLPPWVGASWDGKNLSNTLFSSCVKQEPKQGRDERGQRCQSRRWSFSPSCYRWFQIFRDETSLFSKVSSRSQPQGLAGFINLAVQSQRKGHPQYLRRVGKIWDLYRTSHFSHNLWDQPQSKRKYLLHWNHSACHHFQFLLRYCLF